MSITHEGKIQHFIIIVLNMSTHTCHQENTYEPTILYNAGSQTAWCLPPLVNSPKRRERRELVARQASHDGTTSCVCYDHILAAETKVGFCMSIQSSHPNILSSRLRCKSHKCHDTNKLIVLSGKCDTSSLFSWMVSNSHQRLFSYFAHMETKTRNIPIVSNQPMLQLDSCLIGPKGRMCPAIPMQSSNRQWNWSYQHKYAALLPKYKPSWAVIQNWLTGVRQKQESVSVFRPF